MPVDDLPLVYSGITLADLPLVATALLKAESHTKVWLFVGDMGAGKTTLIKEICRHIGVTEAMSSPTFSIINEYQTRDGEKVFHFDFYRIKREEEAIDIGTEDYFYSGQFCFVEWPERVANLIPEQYTVIKMESVDSQTRIISMKRYG
jgi:tRNA threonylcarbamoyladenosine biosynthesis protein TsaE